MRKPVRFAVQRDAAEWERRRRRGSEEEPENPDSYWEFKSFLSPPSDAGSSPSLSVFLSLSALNVSPLPSVFTSLTVSASSCLLCYAHKIDMLPPGMQTSATNASTLKRRGDTQRAKNCPGSRSRVKTVCFL